MPVEGVILDGYGVVPILNRGFRRAGGDEGSEEGVFCGALK